MTYTATRERDMINPDTQQPMIDDSGRVMKEQVEVTIPSFRITNVFDVKQTSGRPLPTIVDDLEGSVQGYRDFKDTAAEMIDSIEMELMEIRHVYVEKSEALEAFDQGEHVFDSPERGMTVPARRRDISDADEGAFFRVQREEGKRYKI